MNVIRRNFNNLCFTDQMKFRDLQKSNQVNKTCSIKVSARNINAVPDREYFNTSAALTTSIDEVCQELEKLKSSHQTAVRKLGDADTEASKTVSK